MDPKSIWQSEEHPKLHGIALVFGNQLRFLREVENRVIARCFNYVLHTSKGNATSMFDIGCAAGDYYGYLRCLPMFDKLNYQGFDISKTATDAANKFYKTDIFNVIGGDSDLEGKSADVVLSVNVVLHQMQPFNHLEQIINCTKKYLVVSLRTRDTGETEWNPELSCQRIFGGWVPFMVINTDELYRNIFKFAGGPLKITNFKNRTILGGTGYRFLPKELYEEDSGTAVSTLIIEKCQEPEESRIDEYLFHASPRSSGRAKRMLSSGFTAGIKNLGLAGFTARRVCEKIRDKGQIASSFRNVTIQSIDPKPFIS